MKEWIAINKKTKKEYFYTEEEKKKVESHGSFVGKYRFKKNPDYTGAKRASKPVGVVKK